jgi:hypothetical protein
LHSISMDVRYIAKSTWMCGYAQDVRYFAGEHMDVRREACQFCTAHQCGAIVHGLHNAKAIATGYAVPSYTPKRVSTGAPTAYRSWPKAAPRLVPGLTFSRGDWCH